MVVIHHSPSSLGPLHPPKVNNLLSSSPSNARRVKITVKDPLDHEAPAILHTPPDFDEARASGRYNGAAVVLISGAGGGVSGPSGIYPSLSEKLALLLSTPSLRLDYREPAATDFCTADVLASFTYLEKHFSATKFVLVGWSFGGAPCFSVAGRQPGRVAGVATVASQTAGTSGIKKMPPRPVLLMHGTGDSCLSDRCSKSLYAEYGEGKGKRELHLFEGDDHGLSRNAPVIEKMVFDFAAGCLGLEGMLDEGVEESAGKDLAGSREERVREMQAGHDLEGGERL